jgi:hypothetical protein
MGWRVPAASELYALAKHQTDPVIPHKATYNTTTAARAKSRRLQISIRAQIRCLRPRITCLRAHQSTPTPTKPN